MFRFARRLRWSLRTLLALVFCCAAVCGYIAKERARIARRHAAIAEIRAAGGAISSGFAGGLFSTAAVDWQVPRQPPTGILTAVFGDEALLQVQAIMLHGPGAAAAAAAHRLPLFDELKDLSVSETAVGDDDLTCLERMHVTNLDLSGTDVGDATIRLLRGKPELRGLKLSGTLITDAALETLADLPNIRDLSLDSTSITDAGLRSLARMTHLTHLNLANTEATDAGLVSLASLPTLEWLELDGTKVTEAGIRQLAPLAELKLRALRVPDTLAPYPTLLGPLRAVLPGVEIELARRGRWRR